MPSDAQTESVVVGSTSGASADFVRKLYSMLEDPANRDLVRWGREGDTFLVLNIESFTRRILPKHFKHSNFSSFVRQLNKYDFHKVKRHEDGFNSPLGANASEFKHPEFKINQKDSLDNIRRKNPIPKRGEEHLLTTSSLALLNDLASTTQQQVEQLQETIQAMTQSQNQLKLDMARLHKIINIQKQSQREILNYVASSLKNKRKAGVSADAAPAATGSNGLGDLPQELRQATELLQAADMEMEQSKGVLGLPVEPQPQLEPQAPLPPPLLPPPPPQPGVFAPPGPADLSMASDPMNTMGRFPIYQVGPPTVAIDPFQAGHISAIPYQLPSNPAVVYSAQTPPELTAGSLSVWGKRRPKVLLVEDDVICSRIGVKFLKTMDCTVEIAEDGVEAVAKVESLPVYFDIIFMDIIMPGLDGASATNLIRQVAPSVPVIAMTSNIKPEDVQWYAEHGMNGVLAKPFTTEGMLRILKQQIPHLLKEAEAPLVNPINAMNAIPVIHALNPMTPINSVNSVNSINPINQTNQINQINQVPAMDVLVSAQQQVTGIPTVVSGGAVKFQASPPAPSRSPSTTSTSWNNSPGSLGPPPPAAVSGLDPGFSGALNNDARHVAAAQAAQIQAPAGTMIIKASFSPDMAVDDRPSKRPKKYGK